MDEKIKERIRKNGNDIKFSRISVADFEVESSTENLKELEACMNRLIEKNSKFVDNRRKKALVESSMFG